MTFAKVYDGICLPSQIAVLPNAAANIPLPTAVHFALRTPFLFFCNSFYINFSSASEQDECQIVKTIWEGTKFVCPTTKIW